MKKINKIKLNPNEARYLAWKDLDQDQDVNSRTGDTNVMLLGTVESLKYHDWSAGRMLKQLVELKPTNPTLFSH